MVITFISMSLFRLCIWYAYIFAADYYVLYSIVIMNCNSVHCNFYSEHFSYHNGVFFLCVQVLCEVEAAMISLSTWHNRKMPDGQQTTIIGGPGWDPNPDHTTMMIQDWGVLTIYYRFLKDWLHISRKMVQDQVDFHQRWSAVSAVASGDDDGGDDNDDSSSASTIDRLLPVTPQSSSPSSLSPQSSSPQPCIRHRRCSSSKFNKRPKKSGSVT